MKILALDASSEACSVALYQNGRPVAERYEVVPRQHTQKLLPQVDAVLSEAALTLGEVDAIAFGEGPGAFTGVRIATATAQGLAQAANKPLIGVSTLAALAWLALAEQAAGQRVMALLDARMQEYYFCAFERTETGIKPISEQGVCAPSKVPSLDHIASLIGSGQSMQASLPSVYQDLGFSDALPRAGAIAALASMAPTAGDGMPVYLRNNVTD